MFINIFLTACYKHFDILISPVISRRNASNYSQEEVNQCTSKFTK